MAVTSDSLNAKNPMSLFCWRQQGIKFPPTPSCEPYCNQPAGGRPDLFTLSAVVSDEVSAVVINDHCYINFCPAERFGCDLAEVFIEAYHCRETALVSSTLMFAAETHRSSASVLGCGTGHPAGGRGVNNSSREERRARRNSFPGILEVSV